MPQPIRAKSPNQEGRILLAIQAIKLGQIEGTRTAAVSYNISESTLRNRIKGRYRRAGLTTALKACDTCRARKQRCDEHRPKCGLCQRMKQDCNYREPQPTKKDKILNSLTSLEGKVDCIPKSSLPPTRFGPAQLSPASQASVV